MALNPLILGSHSPRRRDILSYFSIPFKQVPSNFPEEIVLFKGDPKQYVQEISLKKGLSLAKAYPDNPILTADTCVFLDKKIYSKPKHKKEARGFLKELSGKSHAVYTAVDLHYKQQVHSHCEKTLVTFYTLSDRQIQRYTESINCLDKAGAYAAQMPGSIIIKEIQGCYHNVLGLPLSGLNKCLSFIGIDLWENLP